MGQLIAVLISFSIIPILIKLKLKLSYTLMVSVGFLFIISSLGLEVLGKVLTSIFIVPASRSTVLTIIMVSLLGGLMKHYKILDTIVETILLLISRKKNVLVIIPAMLGILAIPGGALLSAPFIDDIGQDMDVKPARRAAINLAFRHLAQFFVPYTTNLLLVAAILPNLNILKFIIYSLPFSLSMVTIGYILFLKDIKSELLPPKENIFKNLRNLVIYTSPIYTAVIINMITGLPFYITLMASVFIVYLLSDKKDFLKVLIGSINWNTVITVIVVLIMKETILNMEDLVGLFSSLLNTDKSILYIMGTLLASTLFFGFITGNFSAALAIMLPMLVQITAKGDMIYVYTHFIFGSAFLGYYFSPLHLCQAFTIEYMGVSTGELYKEYRIYAPMLLLLLIMSTMILRLFIGA